MLKELYLLWLRLAAPQDLHYINGADTLPPPLAGEPLISILIPCYNEGDNVADTIHAALAQQYPNIEVIAINEALADSPESVNSDPYGSWFFKLKPSDTSELDKLLDADGYAAACNA